MSVIVKKLPIEEEILNDVTLTKSSMILYCKGAPEMIASLCRPESVPINYSSMIDRYSQRGYRLIAFAYRSLTDISYVRSQRASREEVCN
jgi:cation-transporting ATPase 13A3/4/5